MRVAIARLSWMSATSLSSPMRWRQQRAQHLVREVVHVLEDRQPRHQPRRQRRAAGRIRIDGSELLLEEAPVDRRCELHHWMIKVDDLVEPRPEEIALSGLPRFIRPHESPRRRPQAARESRPARRINLQENLSTTAATRQSPANTITSHSPKVTETLAATIKGALGSRTGRWRVRVAALLSGSYEVS